MVSPCEKNLIPPREYTAMVNDNPLIKPVNIDDSYIQQVFNYYMQCYLHDPAMQLFVGQSSRIPHAFRYSAHVGVCNRTLGKHILAMRTLTGGAMRGSLKRSQLLNPSGHELFRSCIIFPTMDKHNHVIAAIGYRYGQRIRHWQSPIIQWRKPESDKYITQGFKFIQEMIYG